MVWSWRVMENQSVVEMNWKFSPPDYFEEAIEILPSSRSSKRIAAIAKPFGLSMWMVMPLFRKIALVVSSRTSLSCLVR